MLEKIRMWEKRNRVIKKVPCIIEIKGSIKLFRIT